MTALTLYDKLWRDHVVSERDDGTALLYIDRHLIHEVTSPQAFASLTHAGRTVRRRQQTLAVADHSIPTTSIDTIDDATARLQVSTLRDNCAGAEIRLFDMGDTQQGIVHVVGPEQGFTLPGTTIVCGDSHTSTHGAFGALAFGIGTSEVEHVLATQCLPQKKMRNMRITINGQLANGVTAKDMALYIIGRIGTAGGTGYAIEFAGEAVRALSMEGRMTLCNMAIEAGARTGLVAVDQTTIDYASNRPLSPKSDDAIRYWQTLHSDKDAVFACEHLFDAADIAPQVTWGTSPEMVCAVTDIVPSANNAGIQAALDYMGLTAGTPIRDIRPETVFIGSCTNSRLEDLRAAAAIMAGKHIAVRRALVVPGSGLVRQQAEAEGLHNIFINAGCEWRLPGCSMCIAMNPDKLAAGERCASTSNRNFEGRQGQGGRTHLVSPQTAALAAILGHFDDVRRYL